MRKRYRDDAQYDQLSNAVVRQGSATTKILALICFCIVLGMLAVGLGPFGRPHNDVSWLGDRNGLSLTGHSTILSQGAFTAATDTKEASSSIEIWVQLGRTNVSATLLGFSAPKAPNQLLLERYASKLVVTRENTNGRRRRIGLGNVFQPGKPVFITITSGPRNTNIYLDGVLAEAFPGFRLERDMTGRLVIGTSPEAESNWHGELRGLAIYSQELTAEQVSRHYAEWIRKQRPEVSDGEGAVAVYLFNERAGSTVHNSIAGGMNLIVPDRYLLLHQKFLEPFWEELTPARINWKDISINIVGFIPLGLAYSAFWSFIRPRKHAVIRTLVLGFAVSLTIEVVQSYLPTRSSGTTDLINNTLGTYLGVKLCRLQTIRNLIARFCPAENALLGVVAASTANLASG